MMDWLLAERLGIQSVRAQFCLKLIGQSVEVPQHKSEEVEYSKHANSWGGSLIKLDELHSPVHQYLKDDKLLVRAELKIGKAAA